MFIETGSRELNHVNTIIFIIVASIMEKPNYIYWILLNDN